MEPEQPLGDFFKTRFSVAKGNLEGKVKKKTWSGLDFKRKRKPKSLSEGKGRKVKDIFTEEKKMNQ